MQLEPTHALHINNEEITTRIIRLLVASADIIFCCLVEYNEYRCAIACDILFLRLNFCYRDFLFLLLLVLNNFTFSSHSLLLTRFSTTSTYGSQVILLWVFIQLFTSLVVVWFPISRLILIIISHLRLVLISLKFTSPLTFNTFSRLRVPLLL